MNNNKRIIAFGDIHGCFKAVKQAVLLSQKNNFRAIFLGDYVERGIDSIKTLEILMTAKKENPDWIFLKGNHDQWLLDLIEGKAEKNGKGKLDNGANFSYFETTKTLINLEKQPSVFQEDVHIFLSTLKSYYENGDFIFVHNPLRDNSVSLSEKSLDELISNYLLEPIWSGKPFIHGHALVKIPTKINKGININTECGYGGYLTGILVDANKTPTYYSISEDGKSISEKKFNEL